MFLVLLVKNNVNRQNKTPSEGLKL